MNHFDDPGPDGPFRRRHLKTWLAAGAFMPGPFSVAARAAWATAPSDENAAGRRIVVLGGTLTEIVFALGAGGQVVGTDRSSLYPPAATKLPQVGYYRQFSVEGVAALKPDLVIAAAESGPPQAMQALKGLGVRVETLSLTHDVAELARRVQEVGNLLDRAEQGRALAAQIRAQVADATRVKRPVGVIAVSRHAGRLAAAGRGTAADALFRLLGARNLLADAHQGYKPLSAESLAALRPDVIVTSSLSVASGGIEALRAEPGLSTTPAARGGHIIVLDDLLLLGFGPRVGEALRRLGQGLARVSGEGSRVAPADRASSAPAPDATFSADSPQSGAPGSRAASASGPVALPLAAPDGLLHGAS